MAIRQIVTKTLAAASATNIATSQTPAATSNLTINGSTASGGVATLDTQRRVLVTFGNEAANRTLQITGTNQSGQTIQETVAIASGAGATIATLQDFYTITRIYNPGGAFTTNVTVGTNGVGSSPWQRLSEHMASFQVGFAVVTSGTINWTIEYTLDDLEPVAGLSGAGAVAGPAGLMPPICTPFDAATGLTSQTGNASGAFDGLTATAWRLTINSGSGSATATGIQAGIRN